MNKEAEELAEQIGKTAAKLRVLLIKVAVMGEVGTAPAQPNAWRMYAAGLAIAIANEIRAWANGQIAAEEARELQRKDTMKDSFDDIVTRVEKIEKALRRLARNPWVDQNFRELLKDFAPTAADDEAEKAASVVDELTAEAQRLKMYDPPHPFHAKQK